MENNELDNFFRQNAHKMDEAPGDALWQRIEQQMATGTFAKTPWWAGKRLFALMALGVIAAGALVYISLSEPKAVQKQGQPTIINNSRVSPQPGSTTITTADTVKPVKAIPFKVIHPKPVAKTAAFAPITQKQPIIIPQKTDSLQMHNAALPVVATKPAGKSLKLSVNYNPKRTVITVQERNLGRERFDSLTAASIAKYKDNKGMQLIVKAPGGDTFRYTIPDKKDCNCNHDSIATANNISFKTDTLKKMDVKVEYILREPHN